MSRTCTCAACGKEFESAWSQEEARAEFDARFPDAPADDELVVVCDACYQGMEAAGLFNLTQAEIAPP